MKDIYRESRGNRSRVGKSLEARTWNDRSDSLGQIPKESQFKSCF